MNGQYNYPKAQRYISKMTENEKRARLNEYGKDMARMYPDLHGAISFNFQEGKYTGKAKMELCLNTSKKQALKN